MKKSTRKVSLSRETLLDLTGGRVSPPNTGSTAATGHPTDGGTSCNIACPLTQTCLTHCNCPSMPIC